ncbi:MAG: hypothetical protein ACUVX1_12355 [Chloroflexota bacterium]
MFEVSRLWITRWGVLAAVVAVAAYSRLSYLDLVEFKGDEVAVSNLAVMLAERQHLPLVGIPSSVGIANPPAFVYLMTLPYLFTRDPALATGFIGALGILAVLACYYLTREYFGSFAAAVAGLLFAASPWAIMYSRKVWAQDVLPVFALLLMATLYAYAVKGRSWQLAPAILLAALLPQIHFSGVALMPLLLLVVVIYRDRFCWLPFLCGVALATLTLVPYLIWQVTHNWGDVRALLSLAQEPTRWDLLAVHTAMDMVSSRAFYSAPIPGDEWLFAGEGVLFLLGIVHVVGRLCVAIRLKNRGQSRSLTLLLLWLLLPVVIFSRHSIPVYPYYLLAALPAQFIVVGVFLSDLNRLVVPRLARSGIAAPVRQAMPLAFTGAVALLIGGMSAVQVCGYATFISSVQWGVTPSDYGVPLRHVVQTVDAARTYNADHPDRPVYLAAGGNDLPAVVEFLARDRLKLKAFDAQTTLVLPRKDQDDCVYIAADDATPAARFLRDNFSHGRLWTAQQPLGRLALGIYCIGGEAAAEALDRVAVEPLASVIDNGVKLLGWQAPRRVLSGEALPVTLVWTIGQTRETSQQGYSFFTHLVDARTVSWGGVDALGYDPREWQAGDVVITWHQVPVRADAPGGQYWVLLGMYDREGVRRLAIRDEGGGPVDSLRLGPIKVVPRGGLPRIADAAMQSRQEVWLEDKVELLGYDLSSSEVRPGDVLRVTLHWRGGEPKEDYTVFVHLMNEAGQLVAQVDSQPGNGAYPTSIWDKDEYVRDEHFLSTPRDLPEGDYTLVVGMYLPQNGQRIQVLDRAGMVAGDAISLDTLISVR